MNGAFWIDLGERTLRAFAQGFLAALTLKGFSAAVPIADMPWLLAVELGASTAIMCLITGLTSIPVGDKNTASFLPPADQTVEKLKGRFRPPHRHLRGGRWFR